MNKATIKQYLKPKFLLPLFLIIALLLAGIAYLILGNKNEKQPDTEDTLRPPSYPETNVVSSPNIEPNKTEELVPVTTNLYEFLKANIILNTDTSKEVVDKFPSKYPIVPYVYGDTDTQETSGFFQTYYGYLSSKMYDQVYNLGSQGRTVEQIKETYKNVNKAHAGYIEKISDNEFKLQVSLEDFNGNMSYYMVNVIVGRNSEGKVDKIVSSTSQAFSAKVGLDCQLVTSQYVDDYILCFVIDLDTGIPFKPYRGSQLEYENIRIGRVYTDKIYLHDSAGAALVGGHNIYEYDIQNKSFKFVDYLDTSKMKHLKSVEDCNQFRSDAFKELPPCDVLYQESLEYHPKAIEMGKKYLDPDYDFKI